MSEYVMQTRQILSRCSRYSTICCSEGRGASVVYGGRTESRMLLRPLAENPQDTLSDMIFLSIKGYEETRSTLTMGSNAGTCKETLPYGGSTSNMIWHRLTGWQSYDMLKQQHQLLFLVRLNYRIVGVVLTLPCEVVAVIDLRGRVSEH